MGDGWPSADRQHASFLYRLGSTTLLVDCGDGLSTSYKASGLSYDAVDAVLISHLHSDHVGGLSMFLQGLWLERRTRPLTLCVPANAVSAVQAWLNATLVPADLFGFPVSWHPLVAGEPFSVGDVRVTAHPTTHLDSLRQILGGRHPGLCFDAFSFLFEIGDRRIAHTADIGSVDDLGPLLREPLSTLVSELAHVEPDALFRTLRGALPGQVIFMHLARPFWSDRPGTEALVRQELPGAVTHLAVDGAEFQI